VKVTARPRGLGEFLLDQLLNDADRLVRRQLDAETDKLIE
jgi:hypothetical protein